MKHHNPRLRAVTFVLSVLLHAGLAGSMMWFDLLVQWHEEALDQRRYQVLMLPKPPTQRKVLYYDFRKQVPEVAPERPFGAAKIPQGERDSASRTLIAQSLQPASKRQFIWQPKHPEPIAADIPAPNLAQSVAPASPAPKPPRKVFLPPPQEARPNSASALALEPPPPPVHGTPARLQDERFLHDIARPELELAKKPPLKRFVAPAPPSKPNPGPAKWAEPPPLPAQNVAGEGAQAVIVGLDPTARLSAPIPEGSRSAQFAHATAAGAPSSGTSTSRDALRVPGVTAHASPGQPSDAAAARPANTAPQKRTLTEIRLPPVNRTMSAPLRPSSRIVPATVEARFARRDVYVLVFPGPKLAGYAGDWVLWFAPHQANTGGGVRIQAPIPARKEDSGGDSRADPGSAGKGSVQFQAVVDSKGRVLSPEILNGANSEAFRRRAVSELLSWEFSPSLRNGEAIDVDVVLEIPFEFRLPAAQAH